MINQRVGRSQRLAWLEGIRILAVVMLLLYYAQMGFTGSAYTPQPTGLDSNMRHLATAMSTFPKQGALPYFLSLPSWFGFQFVDVFVLISGFSLVLSLKEKPLNVGIFLKRRLAQVLFPFWAVAWLSFPLLWAIAMAFKTAFPNPWYVFAGISFPLVYDYNGKMLMATSGSWWFVSLIFSFAILFPFLWQLLQRWGAANLVIVCVLLTLGYRAIAVYILGGHPSYVIWDTPAGWQPFALFLSKLGTFVIGISVGNSYLKDEGPVYWGSPHALTIGAVVYIAGFICQFYTWGWIFADLLLSIGLSLGCMVMCRILAGQRQIASFFIAMGGYSYTFFLMHGLVVDRILQLVVQGDATRYAVMLPIMIGSTLILAVLTVYTSPLIQRIALGLLRDVDYVLTTSPSLQRRFKEPQVGDEVCYRSEAGWIVLKVEKLLDEQEFFLCQVSDGRRSLWVNEDDLKPARKHFR
ncbi:acyltransferase [Phormidium sp. CLA17]|uniref:acyltransferase family protein n=1 Tax=Leptolyngbya sp. Cla-17 TaxID=2803751 RepID=UPI001492E94F|nr:acyltransferase [Leptolyngbya sp. Cla-17]MBM0743170.1 acyltransferase [Leptolyngbya sp. Cla-17]